MLHFSFSAGRWLGVQVRVHISLVLLLALAAGYSAVTTGSLVRGIALWLALCAAVLVREVTRAIAAAYCGLPLRALFLLPIGGVMGLGSRRGGVNDSTVRRITIIGSLANFAVALLLLGFAYGIDPHVSLLQQPWIGIEHILRSVVWLQLVVGAVNLLPSHALPGRRAVRAQGETAPNVSTTPDAAAPVRTGGRRFPAPLAPALAATRAAFGFGTALALALMLAGIVFGLLWPVLLGLTLLLTTYLNRMASMGSTETMGVVVRDVMLTEYKPLSASTTLRDALMQTTQTAQEIFPVLRGELLVGWVTRSTLLNRLRVEGDGFLQGVMARSFQAAQPGEKLGDALRRASTLGAAEFIPVVDEGAMVGMLTPGNLERAVNQWRLTRLLRERDAA